MTDLTRFDRSDDATAAGAVRVLPLAGDLTHALAARLILPAMGLTLLWLVIEADPNTAHAESVAPLAVPEAISVSALPG